VRFSFRHFILKDPPERFGRNIAALLDTSVVGWRRISDDNSATAVLEVLKGR
jgi:hypothetical protein